MEKGKIIYLNGLSASGKTTLAETLQNRLNKPFYWVAQDVIVGCMYPQKFLDDAGFLEALSLLFHTVKFYSDMGINSIVDVAHYYHRDSKKIWNESLTLLHEYPVLFVHVTCPPEERRRRRAERGDPEVDENKWAYWLEQFEPKEPYDITVDTFKNSPEECAEKIIKLLDYPEKFTAFKTLWAQRSN